MSKRLLILATAILCATGATAQKPSFAQQGQDSDPKLPPPNEQIPEKIKPDLRDESRGGPTLSEKLEKSDGVIKPPGEIDPAIKTVPPEPNPNSMPIIKPPENAK